MTRFANFPLISRLLPMVAFVTMAVLAGCGAPLPEPGVALERDRVDLTRALLALGPDVDASEARRLADIAYDYPLQLARIYEIEDAPIVHNQKVNYGLKSRGLCYHWAEDMQTRLAREGFRSIEIRRGISPARPLFPFEHSSIIAVAPGQPLQSGLLLDPWRYAGALYWLPVADDRMHRWQPRVDVLRGKARRKGVPFVMRPATGG